MRRSASDLTLLHHHTEPNNRSRVFANFLVRLSQSQSLHVINSIDGANMTAPSTAPLALVLGHSGAIGGAIASALAFRGYRIRALVRKAPATSNASYAVEWTIGDALNKTDVIAAAHGATLIVHAVNPPGYTKWREVGIPMLTNAIDAAAASSATILFPANVYVFSPKSGEIVSEVTPMTPETRKGQVRLEMETMLADAAATRGVRTIAVRAGDFFGPGVVGSWFPQALAKGGRAAKVLRDLSPANVGHSWAYVPDLAEAFARLADRRETLAPYELVNFRGHWCDPGRKMTEAAHRIIGRKDLAIKPFPWFTMYLGAPFVTFLREAIEMLWLWKHPLRLDNSKLERLIGPEPHTHLDVAVSATLDSVAATPVRAAA
jgi:nucleoside-diphosphate-sugar epimerase